ncbi:DegT/DnrJ/EryC1/StrS family aminotransferase [Azospirillum agricola]|uniref:DegT/DnrJ/EryC1/StrS family aminotransferase n=1 Tax=Azospirillum agricola TaxID=1720247 RepID=UPI000A0EF0EC|nr:DegT/DnrJ/EryC1/StrS family aminotransferase [Azospirillum agricola]SMH41625.1 dTDP-4-amino-4,6-dideoxygalactose transaminase [Azospirillum lipoferum]
MNPAPKPPIPIAVPCMGEEEWLALREPIETGWLTQGPKVAAFERAFGERHGVRFALASTSCTTALHLVLAALGIGPGDEVIVPAFTWVSTVNVVLLCGAVPVFADVDPHTFNIRPDEVERCLTSRTRAVIAVHLFGRCAEIDAIRAALPPDVHLVEDAACAAGASYRGRPAGGLGTAGVFSFHPRKSITTGEGGMVTTNDPVLAERVAMLRNHGASTPEEVRHTGPKPFLLPAFDVLGFNYRMTDLQGAVGLVQLGKLDRFVDERAAAAALYREALADLPWLRLPAEPEEGRHAWQAFVVSVNPETAPHSRNAMMELLQEQGIATRPGTHAVHMLGHYRDRFGLRPDDFPGARDCDRHSMAIPLHNRMTHDDYTHVIDTLHSL